MNTIGTPGWLKDEKTQKVMQALGAEEDQARFVGGCIRNTLMGRDVSDIDIATKLRPEAVIKALEAASIKAIPTGMEHGTITAIMDGKPFEITTLRKDVKTDGRHAEIAFSDNWAVDAARRDFTINALYAGLNGTLYDPLGTGLEGIKAKDVTFIGDAEKRIREDYLRILRFFRFTAEYGGEIDATGLQASKALKEGLKEISAERIWLELAKLLTAFDPRNVISAMAETGILSLILGESGKEDLALFDAMVTSETAYFLDIDPMVRLMALIKRHGDAAIALKQKLKLSNAEGERLLAWAKDDTKIESYMSMREVRRACYLMGAETFRDRLFLEWAASDNPRVIPQWHALIAMTLSWERPQMPIKGEDVVALGAKPGPVVGQVIKEVEDWWIDADFTDDRLSVIERLKAVAQALIY